MGRVLFAVLALALAGCAQTSLSVSTPGQPVQAAVAPVPVGLPVTVRSDSGTATLTVRSVRYHDRSSGAFNEPSANGRYAVADVEVRVSAGRFDYNAANVSYQGADDRLYGFADGHAAVAGYGPQLHYGSLGAGQAVRGFVTFDVPRGRGSDVQVSDPGGQIVAEWKLR